MTALSVRVSEDPARPLGHAIVTLGGLPRTLETFEFALSRHGFGTNHLGPEGWQGAESWLQPEEAWFSGDLLKFVIHPDLVFQLENMPYQLMVRGQGLPGTAAATFVWPLQLELEEGSASGERKVVGGTRVNPAPAPRPEPPFQPPPLPQIGTADLPIPDMPIPDLGGRAEPVDDDATRGLPPLSQKSQRLNSARASEYLQESPPPLPSSPPAANRPGDSLTGSGLPITATGEVSQATADPGLDEESTQPAARSPALVLTPSTPVAPAPTPVTQLEPASQGKSSLTMVLAGAVLLALAAAGWWWFNSRANDQAPANDGKPPIVEAPAVPTSPRPATETPIPAPKPAARPIAPPEPVPMPSPTPTPVRPLDTPVRPTPVEPPVSQPRAPLPPERSTPATPQRPAPPGSGPSLEDELNSQFDPTQQELEKRLRSQRSP